MNTDTIVARFVKKFGPPKNSQVKSPILIGSELESFGLTFDADSCIKVMKERYQIKMKQSVDYFDTEPIKLLPSFEYQCKDEKNQNVICHWNTSRLMAALHTLDSNPFSRCKAQFTVENMPIVFRRQLDKKTEVAVVVAPEQWVVRLDGVAVYNAFNRDHTKVFFNIECKWLNQLIGTTWWMVCYTDNHGYSEFTLRCANCGTEILPDDYRPEHPQCSCWCSCEVCESIRWKKEYIDGMQWHSRRTWS